MALAHNGMGISAARHSDPKSALHKRHTASARQRKRFDRVVVDISAADERELGIDTSQWALKFKEFDGRCFLADTVDYVLSSGTKRRVSLRAVDGKEFIAAQSLVNRITWYHADMSTKTGKRRVKRKVEKNRLGRVCDRHTVTLAPWQTRLLQKLKLDQKSSIALLTCLQQRSVQSFAEKSGRYMVGSALHTDSRIPHWDIISSRISPDNRLCGEKSLPTTVNAEWTLGAHRQSSIGCELSVTKGKWLQLNLEKFNNRHPGRTPILIELHDTLDAHFAEWVTENGHEAEYEDAIGEYRAWVRRTEPLKEEFAQRKATGQTATQLAERAAMFALRIVLPPSVYSLVKSTMTAAQIVRDLLEGDRNPNATGLVLVSTINAGMELLRFQQRQSKRSNRDPNFRGPRL